MSFSVATSSAVPNYAPPPPLAIEVHVTGGCAFACCTVNEQAAEVDPLDSKKQKWKNIVLNAPKDMPLICHNCSRPSKGAAGNKAFYSGNGYSAVEWALHHVERYHSDDPRMLSAMALQVKDLSQWRKRYFPDAIDLEVWTALKSCALTYYAGKFGNATSSEGLD